MTKPISSERVQWLNERAKVLDECIRITSNTLYNATAGGANFSEMQGVLRTFREERAAISVEVQVLTTHFEVTP